MSDRIFFDSNILVYAYDRHEPRKQHTAQGLLAEAIESESGWLSTQVLGEFFTVVTRRIPEPLSSGEAREIIDALCVLPVQEIDLSLVRRALDTHEQYTISYWDALILSAAERAGCTHVHSEDLSAGQEYHGMLVVNPFAGS